MLNNLLYYYGKYREFETLGLKIEGNEFGKYMMEIAKNAVRPAFILAGLDIERAEELYREGKKPLAIARALGLDATFMPIVNSFIGYLMVKDHVDLELGGYNISYEKYEDDNVLAYVFRKDDLMAVKKVNVKEALPEEASSFFCFSYETSLKYGYKLLNIQPKKIDIRGRGLKAVEYALDQVKDLDKYSAAATIFYSFKQFQKKSRSVNAFAPYPTQYMLIKAYPHLKVRKR